MPYEQKRVLQHFLTVNVFHEQYWALDHSLTEDLIMFSAVPDNETPTGPGLMDKTQNSPNLTSHNLTIEVTRTV